MDDLKSATIVKMSCTDAFKTQITYLNYPVNARNFRPPVL